jgi:hypothetical protein
MSLSMSNLSSPATVCCPFATVSICSLDERTVNLIIRNIMTYVRLFVVHMDLYDVLFTRIDIFPQNLCSVNLRNEYFLIFLRTFF